MKIVIVTPNQLLINEVYMHLSLISTHNIVKAYPEIDIHDNLYRFRAHSSCGDHGLYFVPRLYLVNLYQLKDKNIPVQFNNGFIEPYNLKNMVIGCSFNPDLIDFFSIDVSQITPDAALIARKINLLLSLDAVNQIKETNETKKQLTAIYQTNLDAVNNQLNSGING